MLLKVSTARVASVLILALASAAYWAGANAHSERSRAMSLRVVAEPGVAGAMREGRYADAPPAYDAFCARDPSACARNAAPLPGAYATISPAARVELEAFNASVNAAFKPVRDLDHYGISDYWTLPNEVADCEDYVLYKRARLIEAGWPPESALIAVVRSPSEGYHAVLVLRTRSGELVLDNLRDEVLDWRETGYEWVIRQSTRDPRRWVTIELATGAVGS